MKQFILTCLCIIMFATAYAQNVAINNDGSTPHASAMLDIKSTDKGLLIPRVNLVSESDITTISNPRLSLLIYNNNGTLPDGEGFYYWNGNLWTKLATRTNLSNLAWNLTGNTGTNPANDFIGTTDFKPLVFKTNNILCGKIDPGPNNVFFGQSAGAIITTGAINNSFFGHFAGSSTTSGANNLFAGHQAGNANTTGDANVFLGQEAGKLNTSGARNTIVGEDAGVNNTIGNENTFLGNSAGRSLISNNVIAIGKQAFGGNNASALPYSIAIGDRAGFNSVGNTIPAIFLGHAAGYNGYSGIAIGDSAAFNFSDYRNIAIGLSALQNNLTGVLDIGIGYKTLMNNTNGEYNIALGQFSLINNTTGDLNVAIGNNTLDGNTVGDHNTAIGSGAGFFGANNNLLNTTALGNEAKVSTSNTMVFGDAAVDRWAFGITTTNANHALEVGINGTDGNGAYLTQGGTWTNTSSRQKKENFSDVNGLELLQKIQQMPVQKWKYRGTTEYHIGPVAEDFYKLFGLGTDDKGISTVDPSGIALAAIKEQQRIIEQLLKRIELLEKK
jgi:trimeric autotransporter adhesin